MPCRSHHGSRSCSITRLSRLYKDLIGRAVIAVWNTEEVFHVADLEVGYAPGVDPPRRAQVLERRHDAGEVGVRTWPMEQVEIEMIGAKTGEARVARPRYAVPR